MSSSISITQPPIARSTLDQAFYDNLPLHDPLIDLVKQYLAPNEDEGFPIDSAIFLARLSLKTSFPPMENAEKQLHQAVLDNTSLADALVAIVKGYLVPRNTNEYEGISVESAIFLKEHSLLTSFELIEKERKDKLCKISHVMLEAFRPTALLSNNRDLLNFINRFQLPPITENNPMSFYTIILTTHQPRWNNRRDRFILEKIGQFMGRLTPECISFFEQKQKGLQRRNSEATRSLAHQFQEFHLLDSSDLSPIDLPKIFPCQQELEGEETTSGDRFNRAASSLAISHLERKENA